MYHTHIRFDGETRLISTPFAPDRHIPHTIVKVHTILTLPPNGTRKYTNMCLYVDDGLLLR